MKLTQEELKALMGGKTVIKDGVEIIPPNEPIKIYYAENYDRCDHSGFRIGIYLNEGTAKKNTTGRDDSYDEETLNCE